MADVQGLEGKAAFKKDPGLAVGDDVYPTTPGGTDLGATHLIPFDSATIKQDLGRSTDGTIENNGGAYPSDVISQLSAGPIGGPLKWNGWARMLCCAMGFEQPDDSPASLNSPTDTAWAHLFELDDDLQDSPWSATDERTPGFNANDRKIRRGALGIKFGSLQDVVWKSAFLGKWNLSANPQDTKLSFDASPHSKVSGSYNSANWAAPSGSWKRSLFNQAVVKGGLRSGGEAGLSTLRPSSFEISVDHKLKTDDQTTESGVYAEIPMTADFREVSLKLEFPRYGASEKYLVDLFALDLEAAFSIIFSGPDIVSGIPYEIGFYFSSVRKISADPIVAGPGPVPLTLDLKAERVEGTDIFAANHYEGIGLKKNGEMVVVMHNGESQNYLTEV